MFILSFFADLMSRKSLSNTVSEPLAVLVFGIVLFGVTAGLRLVLSKMDKRTEEILGEMKKAVVISEN